MSETLRRRDGFSAMELILGAAMTAVTMLALAQWIVKPLNAQKSIIKADQERRLSAATNILTQDLIEADPTTIPWSALQPLSTGTVASLQFAKTSYDFSNPSAAPTTQAFQYIFQPDSTGSTGALVRIANGGTTVVLSPIDAPTASAPLALAAKSDPSNSTLDILVITLSYHPIGSSSTAIVRRIAMPGGPSF